MTQPLAIVHYPHPGRARSYGHGGRRPTESNSGGANNMPDVTIDEAELAQLRNSAQAGTDAAAALDAATQREADATTSATAATTALRDSARAANPTLPPDLIDGDTPEAIATSVERARTIAQQVLDAAKAAAPAAGAAPPRQPDAPPDGVTGVARMQWAARQATK